LILKFGLRFYQTQAAQKCIFIVLNNSHMSAGPKQKYCTTWNHQKRDGAFYNRLEVDLFALVSETTATNRTGATASIHATAGADATAGAGADAGADAF
jgi:hypothetical protein